MLIQSEIDSYKVRPKCLRDLFYLLKFSKTITNTCFVNLCLMMTVENDIAIFLIIFCKDTIQKFSQYNISI